MRIDCVIVIKIFSAKLIFLNTNPNVAKFFFTNYPELKRLNRRDFTEWSNSMSRKVTMKNHLKIMPGSKYKVKKNFYINLAIKENLTHRELVRQMDIGYYERLLYRFVILS